MQLQLRAPARPQLLGPTAAWRPTECANVLELRVKFEIENANFKDDINYNCNLKPGHGQLNGPTSGESPHRRLTEKLLSFCVKFQCNFEWRFSFYRSKFSYWDFLFSI